MPSHIFCKRLVDTGAGVRTRISDDVVWLAHAVDQYVSATGEKAFLDENLAFLEGPQLAEGQHDSFFQPAASDEAAEAGRASPAATSAAISLVSFMA